MSAEDHELLRQFIRHQSQEAFTTLVSRHLNLVFSAALRQVHSPQLAEEVAQFVFTQLASHAADLRQDTVLTAWLYQVTRRAAIDTVRREARRQAREQIAFQMSAMDANSAHWTQVEPLLDEAMDSLGAADRTAILLRYFENKSLREVGEVLGASEDDAQKRISRALERLREFFADRKVAVSGAALAAVISANAVQAAPLGLTGAIAAGAVLGCTALSSSTAIALTKTIAMTTVQKTVVASVAAAAVAVGLYEVRQSSKLRAQAQALEEQKSQLAAASEQLQQLERKRERAAGALAALAAEKSTQKNPSELLKLRGEVGRLQRENIEIRSTSPLSKAIASPEARKLVRDQQKVGMGAIYEEFAKFAKLTPEQKEKLNDLLADHSLASIDHVTTALRDGLSAEQMDELFAAEETALQERIQEFLGPDGLAKYQGYNRTLLGSLTTQEFGPKLIGSDGAKAEKAKQLFEAVQQETQARLAGAGLPADYQAVPMLNFRNIASEENAEQSLRILDDIYQNVANRSSSFLSPEELTTFEQFRRAALTDSRAALALNRTLLAPSSK